MHYLIKPWSLNLISDCARIAAAASGAKAWHYDEYLSSFQVGHSGLIVSYQDQAVGCLIAQHLFETVDLLDIQIRPSFQGLGAAKVLLEALKATCQETAVVHIMLEVRQSNARAIAFYSKFGFKIIHIRKAYYASKGNRTAEDAIIMQCKI